MLVGGSTHFVLLGESVARCFKLKPEPLAVVADYIDNPDGSGDNWRKQFFFLPHPSGINTWWNEDFNRFRARKRLREFLELTNP